MVVKASTRQTDSFELLAVSFNYPPVASPRSIQVSRLLKYLRASTLVVCADEKNARRDATIEPQAETHLRGCLRVPFALVGWRRLAASLADRLHAPLWNRTPDHYASWKPRALKAIRNYAALEDYGPDLLITFGQPMSDHLIGLELKRLYQVPWAAHFSDPWTDNPFNRYDALTGRRNLSLERKVIERADRLIFTSEETIEIVMSKYPSGWKDKARVLPHSFDPALYPRAKRDRASCLMVRYTGEFYGRRTPQPLIKTLQAMLAADPSSLSDVCFELVGPIDPQTLSSSGLEALPNGLVQLMPPVNYAESLALIADADGLLIIDAPAERSMFLPSKLIDYIGAGRPILGLTPPGTAADLITQLGGQAAHPLDIEAMIKAMRDFLSLLRHRRKLGEESWGEPQIRDAFTAPVVAAAFEKILREML